MAGPPVHIGRFNVRAGSLLMIKVVISWLQSRLGSHFFIPKFLQPARFEYKKSIRSLKEENRSEECPICYTPIDQDPQATELTTNNRLSEPYSEEENKEPIFPKTKYCYSTPCNHNFHKECITKWFENKPECPVCRTQLPYLE